MAISLLAYHFHRLYTTLWNFYALTDFPTHVWRDSGPSQSFIADQLMLGRCFQYSSVSWTVHTIFLFTFAFGQLVFQPKRNYAFFFALWGCALPFSLHCSLLEKRKYSARKNDAMHLVFNSSLMKEWALAHWKIMEIWLSCWHPFHHQHRGWQSRPTSYLQGIPVLKPSNA